MYNASFGFSTLTDYNLQHSDRLLCSGIFFCVLCPGMKANIIINFVAYVFCYKSLL